MTGTPADTDAAVTALARRSLVVAMATTVLAVACLVAGAVVAYRAATATVAEQVTVTVESEGTHLESRGGRRSRRVARVRHVEVTTEDGESRRMNSEGLRVGDTAEVWRRDDSGALSEDEPSGLSAERNFFLVGGLLLVGLLAAPITIGSWRRVRGLRGARFEDSPALRLVTDRAKVADEPERVLDKLWNLPLRVAASDHPKLGVGSTHDLLVEPTKVPFKLSGGVPEQWEGRVLHVGALKKVVALRPTPQAPWWVTDL